MNFLLIISLLVFFFFFLTTYRCKEEVKIGDNGVEHDDCKRINQLSSKYELYILNILNDL